MEETKEEPTSAEAAPASVPAPEQPVAAAEASSTPAKKGSSWQLILCIVLLVALAGLVIYYWSTGAFGG